MSRVYNGQLYQSQTTEVRLTTSDGQIDFRLATWQDLKLMLGAEGKIANNSDGSIGGYTVDPVKTSGSIKLRLDEALALEDKVAEVYDPNELGFLQVLFGVSIVYGNVPSTLRRDVAVVKFQQLAADLPSSSDPLMVDHPLMVLDYRRNTRAPLIYPV